MLSHVLDVGRRGEEERLAEDYRYVYLSWTLMKMIRLCTSIFFNSFIQQFRIFPSTSTQLLIKETGRDNVEIFISGLLSLLGSTGLVVNIRTLALAAVNTVRFS